MTADVYGFHARNHKAFVIRESRRAVAALERLAGLAIIDLPAERNADGTGSQWSALTHRPPAPSRGFERIQLHTDDAEWLETLRWVQR